MNLNYTTKKTKALIKEAIFIYDETNFIDGLDFIAAWIDRGWQYDSSGCNKEVFIKGDVVIKYGSSEELSAENNRWQSLKNTRYRNNVARVYGIHEGIIIQQRVRKIIDGECFSPKCEHIANKLKLTDWAYNHGHNLDKSPIFFDC